VTRARLSAKSKAERMVADARTLAAVHFKRRTAIRRALKRRFGKK